MRRIISGLRTGVHMVLKWIINIILCALRLFLQMAKVMLLLFGLIARTLLAFVIASTV